ncbi:MAG TPA: ribonuclease P protein component [Flavitalea sp.]|nr:ribonuclease P protein component [Flavitalea sp.]
MAKTFTLGKNERLKQRKFIEQLFREGKSFSVFPFRIYYSFMEELTSPLQAGFSASTRNFKRAVDRNRIKRITKEAYRLQKNKLNDELTLRKKKLAVFFVYTDKNLPAFEIVKDRIQIALQKLITIIHETDTPRS